MTPRSRSRRQAWELRVPAQLLIVDPCRLSEHPAFRRDHWAVGRPSVRMASWPSNGCGQPAASTHVGSGEASAVRPGDRHPCRHRMRPRRQPAADDQGAPALGAPPPHPRRSTQARQSAPQHPSDRLHPDPRGEGGRHDRDAHDAPQPAAFVRGQLPAWRGNLAGCEFGHHLTGARTGPTMCPNSPGGSVFTLWVK